MERARVVRAPFVPRLKDRVWLLGMFIICGGFGAIAIVGYLSPVVEGFGLKEGADERDRSTAAMLLAGFASSVVRKLKYLVKDESG